MTMPAIAPLESPDPDPDPDPDTPVAAPFEAVGDDVEVLLGKSGGIDTVVGSSTPWQRCSTFEFTQHELVELVVLSAQKEQSPIRLEL